MLEGDYEIFDGEQWTALATGESYFAARGGIHTFRNRGMTVGRLQAVVAPAGLEIFLEKLSTLVLPQDVAAAHELSGGYGVQLLI